MTMLFNKERTLVMELKDQALTLLLVRRGRALMYERILLRESGRDQVSQKIAQMMKNPRDCKKVLLLSRSSVLQKELIFAEQEGRSIEECVQNRLNEVLPYALKDLTYGIKLRREPEGLKGFVISIPERNLEQILAPLEQAGLVPDEIVTEDQALTWLLSRKAYPGTVLLLHSGDDDLLGMVLREGELVFSRSIVRPIRESDGTLPDALQELSIVLLEIEIRVEKIILSGPWNYQDAAYAADHFALPVEKLQVPAGCQNVPLTLYGASLLRKYPRLSLLPNRIKELVSIGERKRLRRETWAAFVLLIGLCLGACLAHLEGAKAEIRSLDRRLAAIRTEAGRAGNIMRRLALREELGTAKERMLSLLKEISLNVPSEIIFEELKIEENHFYFKGQSPSHACLAETVGKLEAIAYTQDVKLDHTRLRKRFGKSYFEFEVSGRW